MCVVKSIILEITLMTMILNRKRYDKQQPFNLGNS